MPALKVGLFGSLIGQAVMGHSLNVSHNHRQNIPPEAGTGLPLPYLRITVPSPPENCSWSGTTSTGSPALTTWPTPVTPQVFEVPVTGETHIDALQDISRDVSFERASTSCFSLQGSVR